MSDSTVLQAAESLADIFELIYHGPDVASGSMSAREVVDALTGITRAFTTTAHERDLGDGYELRVRDVEHASFHLVLEAVAFAKSNPAAATAIAAGSAVGLNAVSDAVSGAYRIITDIAKMIDAKTRLRGARLATASTTFSEGEVRIVGPGDVIILTKEQYELLLSRRVDRQLSQIVSPLSMAKIDKLEMRRSGEELASVTASQRDYFDYAEVTEEKSREGTEIFGTLNSLTKTSQRGTFYTADGVHVPYRYVGGDIGQLLRGFSSREPVRVRGRIKYGADGLPTSIEVQDIDFVQRSFQEP